VHRTVTSDKLLSLCDWKSDAGLRMQAVRSALSGDSWASCYCFDIVVWVMERNLVSKSPAPTV